MQGLKSGSAERILELRGRLDDVKLDKVQPQELRRQVLRLPDALTEAMLVARERADKDPDFRKAMASMTEMTTEAERLVQHAVDAAQARGVPDSELYEVAVRAREAVSKLMFEFQTFIRPANPITNIHQPRRTGTDE